jgi:hypothetical protein
MIISKYVILCNSHRHGSLFIKFKSHLTWDTSILSLRETIVYIFIVVETHYTKFVWIKLVMKMSTKVWKPFLVMTISTHLHVWWGKSWQTSICTWTPLSNRISMMVFRNISWVAVHSLLHGQCNKWIPKSSMVWPHWHHERCGIVGCGIPRWIHSVIKKWADDKQNECVLKWINN